MLPETELRAHAAERLYGSNSPAGSPRGWLAERDRMAEALTAILDRIQARQERHAAVEAQHQRRQWSVRRCPGCGQWCWRDRPCQVCSELAARAATERRAS